MGCNKNFSDLLGLCSPEEIVGKTDYDLNWQSTGHTAEAFQEGDRKTLAGDVIINQEEILALPNGKRLIIITLDLPDPICGKCLVNLILSSEKWVTAS